MKGKEMAEENDWTSRLERLWSESVSGQIALLTEATLALSARMDQLAERLNAVEASLAKATQPVNDLRLAANDEARGLVELASL